MSFIGALNIYTNFIEKLHNNPKPFYDLLHENIPWSRTSEHEISLNKLKKPSLLIQNLQCPKQNNFFQ